jgi:hypothetical protein
MANSSPFDAMSKSVTAALALADRVNNLANLLCGYPPPPPGTAMQATAQKSDPVPVLVELGGQAGALDGAVAAANLDLDRIAALLPN